VQNRIDRPAAFAEWVLNLFLFVNSLGLPGLSPVRGLWLGSILNSCLIASYQFPVRSLQLAGTM